MNTLETKAKVNLNGEKTVAYLTVKKDLIIHAKCADADGTLRVILISLSDVDSCDRPRVAKELMQFAA